MTYGARWYGNRAYGDSARVISSIVVHGHIAVNGSGAVSVAGRSHRKGTSAVTSTSAVSVTGRTKRKGVTNVSATGSVVLHGNPAVLYKLSYGGKAYWGTALVSKLMKGTVLIWPTAGFRTGEAITVALSGVVQQTRAADSWLPSWYVVDTVSTGVQVPLSVSSSDTTTTIMGMVSDSASATTGTPSVSSVTETQATILSSVTDSVTVTLT